MFPMNNIKEDCIIELEAYWNNRMCELVTEDRLDDADALYLEFVVDGEEPEEYLFLEHLNGVC
jgi:hypothetical protein